MKDRVENECQQLCTVIYENIFNALYYTCDRNQSNVGSMEKNHIVRHSTTEEINRLCSLKCYNVHVK